MPYCLIGLGSNLGDRRRILDGAVATLDRHPDVIVVGKSRWFQTAPVGGPADQESFLNGAVLLETGLSPQSILTRLLQIEADVGRERAQRWGPRRLDLDILLYDQLVLESGALTVPHPRMAWRRFVLEPAAEVAPDMIHPATGWTISQLVDHLDTAALYVAVTGPLGVGKTRLARQIAGRIDAQMISQPIDPSRLERLYSDPSGSAWDVEIEFLTRRASVLAARCPDWHRRRQLVVSDFWFDQTLAYAPMWLSAREQTTLGRHFEDFRGKVVQPVFTVMLDGSAQQLRQRICRRGSCPERQATIPWLERLRRAMLALATSPGHGPVLCLGSEPPETAVSEVLAAIESTRAETIH